MSIETTFKRINPNRMGNPQCTVCKGTLAKDDKKHTWVAHQTQQPPWKESHHLAHLACLKKRTEDIGRVLCGYGDAEQKDLRLPSSFYETARDHADLFVAALLPAVILLNIHLVEKGASYFEFNLGRDPDESITQAYIKAFIVLGFVAGIPAVLCHTIAKYTRSFFDSCIHS